MPTLKILLVDDVSMFLEIERGFLRRFPARVITASDGSEALMLARKERPNLIFIDLEMPGMSGDECCRAVKADPVIWPIPVIMIGSQKSQDRERCEKAGCDAFLTKPLDRGRFVKEVRRFLPSIDHHDRRVSCGAVARFRVGEVVMGGEIRDISRRGMFLAARADVSVGDVVDLAFNLPNEGPVQAKGQVCWVNTKMRRAKPSLPEGFGVEFVAFTAGSQQVVQGYLEKNLPLSFS